MSTLTRLRAGDIRFVPFGVWPLIALAIADVLLRVESAGTIIGSALVTGAVVEMRPRRPQPATTG